MKLLVKVSILFSARTILSYHSVGMIWTPWCPSILSICGPQEKDAPKLMIQWRDFRIKIQNCAGTACVLAVAQNLESERDP